MVVRSIFWLSYLLMYSDSKLDWIGLVRHCGCAWVIYFVKVPRRVLQCPSLWGHVSPPILEHIVVLLCAVTYYWSLYWGTLQYSFQMSIAFERFSFPHHRNRKFVYLICIKWFPFCSQLCLLLCLFQDNEGQSALHYAAVCDREAIAEFLVKQNADTDLKDDDGNAAYDLCDVKWPWLQHAVAWLTMDSVLPLN